MSTQIRFYNPREASPELLEAMLVGREGIVQEVLDDLARQATSSSRQHWLIRGPRGIGKTHLVGILYHRLKKDEKLAKRFLPVWLAETDAYSAYSAAVLLIQIAERLVEELRLAGDPGAGELARKLVELAPGGDDPALFEEVCEILREEAQARGKILVILMENLDALLAGLPGQRGAQEVRRLRSLLSQDKELLFISTTPTRYLAAVSDPKQPLYGHLKERSLQALTEDEVGQLLERLAEVTGQTERLAPLREEREGRIRRRVLHRLSGGNPRAVVMAFTVLSGAPGVQAMVEEMSALLDTQTAYFEARLAHLAPRERAIVSAMALSRKNLTLQEIAGLTRLPLKSLSVQIERLREHGYLSVTAGDGGKGTIYEVSDGLFRVWHQYRKGRKILRPIVQFLALWYPDEELENTLRAIRNTEAASLALVNSDLVTLAETQILEALSYSRSEEGRSARQEIWAAPEELSQKEVNAAIDYITEDLSRLEEKISFFNKTGNSHLIPTLKVYIAKWLIQKERYAEAETLAQDVLMSDKSGEAYAVLFYATGFTKNFEKSLSIAEELIQRISQKDVNNHALIAMALFNRATILAYFKRTTEAEEAAIFWADRFAQTTFNLKNTEGFSVLVNILVAFSPSFSEKLFQRLAHSLLPENVEVASLFLNVAYVLKAESIGETGRHKSARVRRQEALAQIPPELRSSVDEIAQMVRSARKPPTRGSKESAPAGPGGALPL